MKKRIRLFCCTLSAIFLLTACSSGSDTATYEFDDTSAQTQEVTQSAEPSFDEDNLFIASGEDGTIVFDSDAKVSGDGLSVEGSIVTVSSEGVYRVSGTASDGQIIVDCTNKDDVTLIFDNLTLNSKNAPAVWCIEADTLTISLPEGSESSISDGSERPDADTPDAAIFSKGDLYFNGTGTLTIEGNANNAIQSKDGLTILQCTLDITAVDDGIIGKDSIEIGAGAVINIDADGDGMRSTNTEDEGRGNIYLGECKLNIDSGADAVQAAVSLTVDSGAELNIISGGGAENGSSGGGNDFGGWGWDYSSSSEEETTSSMKGIKASSAVFINGGVIVADCADDAVHCNGDIHISDGTLTLSSGDDGIHADSELTIAGGNITIIESYEGLEANVITVSGGYIDAVASDDGINVAGGNDDSSTGGMWGNDMFAEDESCLLSVSGGCILINASGDGVDSNGSIKMSGGEMYVSGPTNSGNGFLDFAGDFEITGGTLLALGTSGMAQTTNAGTQASIVASINGTVPSGSVFTLKTADGKEILSYTAPKNYNFIVASSPLMSEGEEVSVYLDGELLGSLEASVIISSGGMSMGGMGGGPGGGGHGGGHGPGGR